MGLLKTHCLFLYSHPKEKSAVLRADLPLCALVTSESSFTDPSKTYQNMLVPESRNISYPAEHKDALLNEHTTAVNGLKSPNVSKSLTLWVKKVTAPHNLP